jgi:Carbohydrate-selective porin, OprB family/S-layer homology domain
LPTSDLGDAASAPLVRDVSDNLADSADQVTSVSQLSDVQPTDWAFQSLRSLVERYGCIAGYPNGTFRGNRAASRYELAAALNACLDQISDRSANKEDLSTIQSLQNEFKAELATLKGRVDGLEARTATLEAQQFSTTTKLTGLVFLNLTGAYAGDNVISEQVNNFAARPVTTRLAQRRDANVTFSYYAWLTLNTSFTGKDALVLQLATGNGNSPANAFVSSGYFNSWGVPYTDQTGTPVANTFIIRELSYSFPVTKNIQISAGPRLNWYRYFDNNRFTFYLKGAGSYNSSGSTLANAFDRGAGAVVAWNISKQLKFTVGYMGESNEFLSPSVFNTAAKATGDNGLFGGTNTLSAELAFSPVKTATFRFLYNRSNLKAYNGFLGGSVGEPLPYGYADDGFGGPLKDGTADTFVANFDWLIAKHLGIFGRYSYGRTSINPVNPALSVGNVRVQSIQAGLAFPDVGKAGALGVISFLIPQDYLSGRQFLLSGNGNGATQYEVEASYYYPLTDNIALIPAVYAIINPNNFDTNPTVFVGNLRTQFSF